MKKLTLLLLSALLITTVAFGQTKSTLSINDIITQLKQDLRLSDDQAAEITPVLSDHLAQIQEIRAQNLEPDAQIKSINSIFNNMRSQLAQYLNAEQLNNWNNKFMSIFKKGDQPSNTEKNAKSNNQEKPNFHGQKNSSDPKNELTTENDEVLQSIPNNPNTIVNKSSILVK
ncbi:MAG: hypothetical protein HQL25_01685 [Candidatus Omnitrophica bacterium]|nr:hypothetical protein [Candidatus Omnitrophota bacterium]